MTLDDADLLAAAARALADALTIANTLRGRQARDRLRALLADAIDKAERALGASEGPSSARARSILAQAYTARAEDALHGAGQLSLSAQRAPSVEACDEGWRRVASLVDACEAAARAAGTARAEEAARGARKLLEERNHAYTFHTDPGFSFGEGWYVAAAGVLAGAAIQIEPGRPGTPHAESFLREAGLADRLQSHRSRPRANKQTTEIVARAFRSDPRAAQIALRAAFLGSASIPRAVVDRIDPKLADRGDGPKVLVWIRDAAHHPGRNTVASELVELAARAERAGLAPILVGDPLREGRAPDAAVDLVHFWKDPLFRGAGGRRAQLQFFEHLRAAHRVVGQLGVTTAGMDGPALMGMPTMYITDATNVRMRAWVGAVPGYREIVREAGYLDRISEALAAWAATPPEARR